MRVLALIVLLAGCRADGPPIKGPAQNFAQLLVAHDYAGAHAMLVTPPPVTREQLQRQFEDMVAPIGALHDTTVMQTMTDWPSKQRGDAGWVYVSINGEDGGEAVQVVVTNDQKIRTIEWGRP